MADSPAVTVTTPLGDGVLTFESMAGTERLGQPFRYELFLLSSNTDVSFSDLLGQLVTVHVNLGNDQFRHFNGYVTEFELVGTAGQNARYRAVLQPWLWFLGLKADCRIFQNMSALDIIKKIFSDVSSKEPDLDLDFEDSTSETYQPSEYAVQYRESDLNFVSRLMEREGIYYFFTHEDGEHKLVLSDSISAHSPVKGYETLQYHPPDVHREELEEYVDDWRVTQTIRSGAFAVTDYNFKQPQLQLMTTVSADSGHPNGDFEVYDYPGGYVERSPGETYGRVRFEEIRSPFARAEGSSNARGLTVGSTFKLQGFPRDDQNAEYLVVSSSFTVRGHDVESRTDVPVEGVFRCRFTVIESDRIYRSPRSARKPVVEGPQTATVVGPDGKEIWVDEFGRVKVQFPWDREGQNNDNSSCYVRVSQVWAGTGWGAVFTPRIGHEVIVDFLEGDPDRPIIVGRVHNGTNMPPYQPKTHPTISGIRSHSSPNGSQTNYNEIRFQDLKGHEELHIQAEKKQTTHVKQNQAITVGGDRAVTVTGNEVYTVVKTRTTDITEKELLKCHDDVQHLFDKNFDTNVDKAASMTVKDDYILSTTDGQIKLVHKNSEFNIKESQDTWVSTENGHIHLDPDGNIQIQNNKTIIALDKTGHTLISASAEDITIQRDTTHIVVTSDKISIAADATVEIITKTATVSADTVSVTAKQKATVTCASSSAELSPSGVNVAGTMIKLNS